MKHKHYQFKLHHLLAIATIIAIVVAIFAASVVYRDRATASTSSESATNTLSHSPFSFDAQKAPGWWQGATNETSMAIFDEDEVSKCFVSAEYIKGIVNADVEIQKINTQLTESGNGYIITPLASQTLELQTDAKPLPYELRQSSVSTPQGAEKVKGGQEFGFIQLSNGYVKIMGYCDNPEQLASTLASLQAIKLDETKLKDL